MKNIFIQSIVSANSIELLEDRRKSSRLGWYYNGTVDICLRLPPQDVVTLGSITYWCFAENIPNL